MTITVIKDVNLKRERILRAKIGGNEDEIHLPFGCKLKASSHAIGHDGEKYYYRMNGSADWAILSPAYTKTYQRSGVKYKLELVTKDSDRIEAMYLTAKEHYLPPPQGGLILVAKTGEDIVGCAYISRMFHGNPHGRRLFAEQTLGNSWQDNSRAEVVNKCGIYWVSRFTVVEGYQGQGVVGPLLAEACVDVVRDYVTPSGRVIEVIRTAEKEEAEELRKPGSEDWLTRAGYIIDREDIKYTPPIWKIENGVRKPEEGKTYRRIYYFRNV